MARFIVLARGAGMAPGMSAEDMQQMIAKYRAWTESLRDKGKLIEGEKLRGGEGKTLRRRGTEIAVTDGPFAESKEILGGFWVIDATSYDEAVALLRDSPHLALGGSLEVRQIEELPSRG